MRDTGKFIYVSKTKCASKATNGPANRSTRTECNHLMENTCRYSFMGEQMYIFFHGRTNVDILSWENKCKSSFNEEHTHLIRKRRQKVYISVRGITEHRNGIEIYAKVEY